MIYRPPGHTWTYLTLNEKSVKKKEMKKKDDDEKHTLADLQEVCPGVAKTQLCA